MTPMPATAVVYDLGDVSSWAAAGLTLLAVVVALVIAGQDRRAARREAHDRWELEQLTRLAVLAAHGGIAPDSSPEAKAAEAERGAERLVLRWILGGPQRFPVGLRANEIDADTLEALRRRRDDSDTPRFVRQQIEATIAAAEAVETYRSERRGRPVPRADGPRRSSLRER